MFEFLVFNQIVKNIVFAIIVAYCFARLEIEIEGEKGWASGLPTWRKTNLFSTILYGSNKVPFTGYHTWLFAVIASLYHFVFLFMPWSLRLEILVFSQIMLTFLIEDFMWFVINPHFGLKKFKKENIKWHANWFLGIPVGYWFYTVVYILLISAYFRL